MLEGVVLLTLNCSPSLGGTSTSYSMAVRYSHKRVAFRLSCSKWPISSRLAVVPCDLLSQCPKPVQFQLQTEDTGVTGQRRGV